MGYETRNMGLPSNFSLEAGAFRMVGGEEKVDDNLRMIVSFIGWFRIYSQDFISNIIRLYQNTSSFLFKYKNIYRLEFLNLALKYAPNVEIISVNIPLNLTDRTTVTVDIKFKYKLDKSSETKTVRYLKAL